MRKTYYVEVISPVHVGSGVRLRQGIDYFVDKGCTWFISQEKLEAELIKNTDALNAFAQEEDFDISTFAREYGLDLRSIVKYGARNACRRELLEFLRSGLGKAMLPGSSVKGAVRTVITEKLFPAPETSEREAILKEVLKAKDRMGVDKPLNKELMGSDPNHDLMRVLQIGDAELPSDNLVLTEVRILNLIAEGRRGWKNFSVFLESLPIGASAHLSFTVDEFLLDSEKTQGRLDFHKQRAIFDELPAIANAYAKKAIQAEKMFFGDIGFPEMVNFYEKIERTSSSLKEGEFLLRLSWGSGWKSMTGDLWEEDELDRIRKKFNLGKFQMSGNMPERCPSCGGRRVRPDRRDQRQGYCPDCRRPFRIPGASSEPSGVFPKTRKIAFENGKPKYPLGWIALRTEKPTVSPIKPEVLTASRFTTAEAEHKKVVKRPPKADRPLAKPAHQPEPPGERIKVGDRLHAEVLEEGHTVKVRLLEKDVGRELSFDRPYNPCRKGKRITVRVVSVSPDGKHVRKIDFVKA